MLFGKISVVDGRDGASFDFLDVTARADPIGAQRGKTLLHIKRNGFVAPRTAGVVNADGFVDFDFAGDRFRRREGDFAEGNAEIRDVDFFGIVGRALRLPRFTLRQAVRLPYNGFGALTVIVVAHKTKSHARGKRMAEKSLP